MVSIRLHDGSLSNGEKLLGLDVAPHLKCKINFDFILPSKTIYFYFVILALKLTIMVNTARSSSLLI